MIASKDRSGWFGASDTDRIMQSWNTKTFENWYMEKIGIKKNGFFNEATLAGTYFEHSIIDKVVPLATKDRQILIPELHLRVNLDADYENTIYEIKTYRADKGFKVPLKYFRQVNVEMFAFNTKSAYIVSYGLVEDDYKNFLNPIIKDRITLHEIEYDESFICSYLKRLEYLSECLGKGVFPNESKIA